MGEDVFTVWTVGHSSRTLDELLELLAVNGIEAVADVRRHAGSRKHPHFNPDALSTALPKVGAEYESDKTDHVAAHKGSALIKTRR